MIIIKNHRAAIKTLKEKYPYSQIFDLTSHGEQPWVQFSPFYPHGNIPVPFSPDYFGMSVEGIWQGLKVFESADVDTSKFVIANMKNIKRTSRKFGRVLGHREGVKGERLLPYLDARRLIYLPTYLWVLKNCLKPQLEQLKELNNQQTLIFLDYETNENIEDLSSPLSPAGLVKRYLEGNWPAQ